MGRRGRERRRRGDVAPAPEAPISSYAGPEGAVLELRGAMTASTRQEYARERSGSPLSQEDAWQRSVEFLFERLVVRWEVSGLGYEGPKELLGRFRMASRDERAWVRDVLREHLAEHFPELEAP